MFIIDFSPFPVGFMKLITCSTSNHLSLLGSLPWFFTIHGTRKSWYRGWHMTENPENACAIVETFDRLLCGFKFHACPGPTWAASLMTFTNGRLVALDLELPFDQYAILEVSLTYLKSQLNLPDMDILDLDTVEDIPVRISAVPQMHSKSSKKISFVVFAFSYRANACDCRIEVKWLLLIISHRVSISSSHRHDTFFHR